MYLVQKNRLRGLSKKEYEAVKLLSRLSKNLYNVNVWEVRRHYELNGSYLNYGKAYHVVKENENYIKLPSQMAQQTMRVVDNNFKSFFQLIKHRRDGNYDKQAKIPCYLPKDGYFLCAFSKDQFKVIDEGKTLRLSLGRWFTENIDIRYLFFKIPLHIQGDQIKEIRILPRYGGQYFEMEYVYWKETVKTELNENKYLGIDLGLDNLAACVTTDGSSFIIDGRELKSYNQLWNKRKARLQSIHDKQGVKFSKKKMRLLKERNDYIRNYMAQAVYKVIKACIDEKIGNVVIGELKDIKQNANLGKRNNQHFQSIPYGLFKQKLRSKCELYGIDYHEVDEAYTSQTCSCCGQVRKSNRIHRGLYKCNRCGIVINADTNGAINIIKKRKTDAFPSNETIGNSGIVNVPRRIRVAT